MERFSTAIGVLCYKEVEANMKRGVSDHNIYYS